MSGNARARSGRIPPRLAVDANGFVWRVYNDGHWSMAPSNSDNSPIPEPISYYEPAGDPSRPEDWDEEVQASIEEARAEGRREAVQEAEQERARIDRVIALCAQVDPEKEPISAFFAASVVHALFPRKAAE